MMKVVVIYDKTKYDKDLIVDEFVEEGYTHQFKFASDLKFIEDSLQFIDDADEVWVFGDVDGMPEFDMALTKGKDIWVMG